MFKVSQDINLNKSAAPGKRCIPLGAATDSGIGRPDASRIQILNFPSEPVLTNSNVNFIINTNGVPGAFEVAVESPVGNCMTVPLEVLDFGRLLVRIFPTNEGIYRLYIKCNSVALPRSPYMIVAQNPIEKVASNTKLPVFHSDSSKVLCNGLGVQKIEVYNRNEFRVDASKAGDNILFVGICGPRGQCDEVSIRHTGGNVYTVIYQVQDPGMYLIAVKWGDDHVPGSPFNLRTL